MKTILAAALFVLLYLNKAPAETVQRPICTQLREAISKGRASAKLDRFFKVKWDYEMHEFPEWATSVGYPGQNARMNDRSLAAIAKHKKEALCELLILNKIGAKALRGEEKVSFDLMQRQLEDEIEGQRFPGEYLAIDQLGGLQIDFADLIESMPTSNKADYENMIARFNLLPETESQTETLLREGIKRQVTALKMFVQRVPDQIDQLTPAKVEDSPLYKPFVNMNKALSQGETLDLRARAKAALEQKVYPSFAQLKKFLITDYIPHARSDIAWSHMPDGAAWYAFQVRQQTTTKLSPKELHELGLKEVERITAAMNQVREQVKFEGNLEEFNKKLLGDDQFFYKNANDLLIGFRDIAKRIDPELPKLFKTLPRLTYGVQEMAAFKAADAPAAYYMPGSLESGRAGYFTANTSDLPHRPKWMMEPLTAHEAVPGHHLQLALQAELKGLPEFRRHGWGYTAFVEGWGLYAESLGSELGLYKDPYSQYGQLSMEMWRAIRLVVDTGIHQFGWTREQAITYFKAHMPKAQKDTENEVDRYITWPGQALAYKVGQLKFLELRARAQKTLGEKFDIREFHEEVLSHGSMPLDVLEKNVNDWLTTRLKAAGRKDS